MSGGIIAEMDTIGGMRQLAPPVAPNLSDDEDERIADDEREREAYREYEAEEAVRSLVSEDLNVSCSHRRPPDFE
jgi:hypothetical protein